MPTPPSASDTAPTEVDTSTDCASGHDGCGDEQTDASCHSSTRQATE